MLCELQNRARRQTSVNPRLDSTGVCRVQRTIIALTTMAWLWSCAASAGVIDFESFNIGDGLDEINAYYEPLGVTFDSLEPSSVQVIDDPDHPGEKVLQFDSPGSFLHHLVVNFDFDVTRVTVDVLDHHPIEAGRPGSLLTLYDIEKTPGPAPRFDGFVFSVFGIAPTTLSFEWNDFFAGPGQVHAIALEQDESVVLHETVDNIFFIVPEVVGPWLGILGVLALARGLGCRRM